jgi:hypothetical protein
MNEEMRTTTSNLLLPCINLTHIKGDRKSLSVIVKLYWDKGSTRGTRRKDIMGQALIFWSIDTEREVGVASPESKSELKGVAMNLELIPPSMSWNDMLMDL